MSLTSQSSIQAQLKEAWLAIVPIKVVFLSFLQGAKAGGAHWDAGSFVVLPDA
jgi:hypothetical protein